MYQLKRLFKRQFDLCVSLTTRCNYHCKHCDSPLQPTQDLNYSDFQQYIKKSISPIHSITLSGGEPFLYPHFYDLLEFLAQYCIPVHIATNGSLITEKTTKLLQRLRVATVNISIEGNEYDHNIIRGNNTYQHAVHALALLQQYSVNRTIATTISQFNITSFYTVMHLGKTYQAHSVLFQPFSSNFLIQPQNYIPKTEQLAKHLQWIQAFARAHRITTNSPHYFQRMSAYFQKQHSQPHTCTSCQHSLALSPAGTLHPCWGDTSVILGNIQSGTITDILNSPLYHAFNRQALSGLCRGCLLNCHDQDRMGHANTYTWMGFLKQILGLRR